VAAYFLGVKLPEMEADSLQQFGDFALLVCQDAMQAMNVTNRAAAGGGM
jgi:hypothetical protein